NCSTGPEDMRDASRFLGETSSRPVHCIPNAGLPLQGPDGETIFPQQPEPLATVLGEFVERYGVSIVGGCCGTTPAHMAALKERVEGRTASARPARRAPRLSSMIAATPLVQDPTPTLVGERVNSQGSRKAKEMLLGDDYDGLLTVAEDQVTGGAHVLDVCVALTERQDEDEQMRQVVKRISLTQPCCEEHGLDAELLIFDCLTFTLTTGDEEWRPSAVATIEGIRAIKEQIPHVKTSLGVSNVSFGVSLTARSVLNSVFLHHCV